MDRGEEKKDALHQSRRTQTHGYQFWDVLTDVKRQRTVQGGKRKAMTKGQDIVMEVIETEHELAKDGTYVDAVRTLTVKHLWTLIFASTDLVVHILSFAGRGVERQR